VRVIETPLDGCVVIEPNVHGDSRGFFYESFNARTFAEAGFALDFVQTNVSRSARGVLRGLHYQWPNPQGKLVSVVEGEVYDVAVDIRVGSPSFGQWTAAILSAENKRHFWVPEGFAHGFAVLSDNATFIYQCTAFYDRSSDAGIRWNDGTIAVDWPIAQPILSDKDQRTPFLVEIAREQLPSFRATASTREQP